MKTPFPSLPTKTHKRKLFFSFFLSFFCLSLTRLKGTALSPRIGLLKKKSTMLKYAPKESHIRTHTHVRIKLYEREISKKPPQKKKKQRKSSHLLSSVAFEKKDENNNGSRNIALILKNSLL